MKFKYLIFILLLMFGIAAFGQSEYRSGYIINNQNDTINGLIDYRNDIYNSNKCKFKLTISDEFLEYAPGEIQEYRFADSKLYVSKEVEVEDKTDIYFLECLIKGQITVYFLRSSDGTDYYFIETDEGLILAENNESIFKNEYGDEYYHNSNQYKGIFKYSLRDQGAVLFKEIDNLKYERDAIIDLSKKYHEMVCDSYDCIIYEKQFPKRKKKFGVSASWGNQSFQYGKSYAEFEGNLSPYWSVSLDFKTNMVKLSERIFFELKFSYQNMNVSTSYETPNQPNGNISFNMNGERLKAGYSYVYPVHALKPLVGLGIFIEHLQFDDYLYVRNGIEQNFTSTIDKYNTFGGYGFIGCGYKENLRFAISYEVNKRASDMEKFNRTGFEYSLTYYF